MSELTHSTRITASTTSLPFLPSLLALSPPSPIDQRSTISLPLISSRYTRFDQYPLATICSFPPVSITSLLHSLPLHHDSPLPRTPHHYSFHLDPRLSPHLSEFGPNSHSLHLSFFAKGFGVIIAVPNLFFRRSGICCRDWITWSSKNLLPQQNSLSKIFRGLGGGPRSEEMGGGFHFRVMYKPLVAAFPVCFPFVCPVVSKRGY